MELQFEIEYFKGMIKSCYVYNNLNQDNQYLKPYKHILGLELFDKIFNETIEDLKNNYYLSSNTFQDIEGISYNSLKKIK